MNNISLPVEIFLSLPEHVRESIATAMEEAGRPLPSDVVEPDEPPKFVSPMTVSKLIIESTNHPAGTEKGETKRAKAVRWMAAMTGNLEMEDTDHALRNIIGKGDNIFLDKLVSTGKIPFKRKMGHQYDQMHMRSLNQHNYTGSMKTSFLNLFEFSVLIGNYEAADLLTERFGNEFIVAGRDPSAIETSYGRDEISIRASSCENIALNAGIGENGTRKIIYALRKSEHDVLMRKTLLGKEFPEFREFSVIECVALMHDDYKQAVGIFVHDNPTLLTAFSDDLRPEIEAIGLASTYRARNEKKPQKAM